MSLASSAPTRAASRRARSARVSSSRRSRRAASLEASASERRSAAAEAASARPLGLRGGGRAALLQLRELGLEPRAPVGREPAELLLQRRDPLGGALVARVGRGLLAQGLQPDAAALGAPRDRPHGGAGRLEPQPDPLAGAAGRVEPARQPLALRAAGGERLLGGLALAGDLGKLALRLRGGRPRRRHGGLRRRQSAPRRDTPRRRASVQPASSICRSIRSCSSAASAWRFSGRSRVRASRSTSSARSRLSCVRSSLSCARRRRLRCLPRPAASSISIRRSRGLDVTIASTRPWETTECISLPRPVSDSSSSTSVSRQRAPLTRYSPSPARLSRRTIEISPAGRSTAPPALSSTTSTSASARACTPWPPAKITSCIDWPRTASGDCSPSAHSTASVTLDLPEPLGPTITETPGANSSRVRSGKDLKPFRVNDLRCIVA